MAYSPKHENRIEQGDICNNLPLFTPSELIPEAPGESKWDSYVKSLSKGKNPYVKYSIYPSPTWGVVLSQTCDIEHPKPGDSIIFAKLFEYDKRKAIDEIPNNHDRKKYLEDILDVIRCSPRKHYLPELIDNDDESYGPWYVSFHDIFFVPVELVLNNLDSFWKARLNEPLRDVLKEKISKFFTRLAFEECFFFSTRETHHYLKEFKRRGKVKDTILETRKKFGYKDS